MRKFLCVIVLTLVLIACGNVAYDVVSNPVVSEEVSDIENTVLPMDLGLTYLGVEMNEQDLGGLLLAFSLGAQTGTTCSIEEVPGLLDNHGVVSYVEQALGTEFCKDTSMECLLVDGTYFLYSYNELGLTAFIVYQTDVGSNGEPECYAAGASILGNSV